MPELLKGVRGDVSMLTLRVREEPAGTALKGGVRGRRYRSVRVGRKRFKKEVRTEGKGPQTKNLSQIAWLQTLLLSSCA